MKKLFLLGILVLSSCDQFWEARIENNTDSTVQIIGSPVQPGFLSGFHDTTIQDLRKGVQYLQPGSSVLFGHRDNSWGQPSDLFFDTLVITSRTSVAHLNGRESIFNASDKGKDGNVLHIH